MNQQFIQLQKLLASCEFPSPGLESEIYELVCKLEKDYKKNKFRHERANYDKEITKNLLNQSIKEVQKTIDELKLQKKNIQRDIKNKEKLFASVSHELKTPLNGIIGMIGLIDETIPITTLKHHIRTIKSSAENLNSILSDSLTYTKLNSCRVSLENEPFSTRLFFKDLYSVMSIPAQEKKLKLIFTGTEKLPEFLNGDKTKIFQIITNLINNSIKYTNDGAIAFTANYTPLSTGRVKVSFEVEDSGIGIPSNKLDLIYESFMQAHKDTQNDGLGLGLNIVKKLVDLMDGYIKVDSQQDLGSIFKVVIPMSVPNEKMAMGYQKSKASKDLACFWKNKRILFVDDNLGNQSFARELFKNWRIPLQFASNCKTAKAMLDTIPFDCVLLDINLPDGNGIELFQKIRSEFGKNRATPVLITSAICEKEADELLEGVPIDGFVRKPYYPEDIAIALDNVFLNSEPQKSTLKETNIAGQQPSVVSLKRIADKNRSAYTVKPKILDVMKTYFIKEGPKAVDIMRTAIEKKDWSSVEFEAHKISSTIKLVGLKKLAYCGKKLEYYSKLPEASIFVPSEFEEFRKLVKNGVLKLKKELTFQRRL